MTERNYTIDELMNMNGTEPCGRDNHNEEVELFDFFTGEPIK